MHRTGEECRRWRGVAVGIDGNGTMVEWAVVVVWQRRREGGGWVG